MTAPLAALDLGTNSTRFICVEASNVITPETVIAQDMIVTRLGEGVDESGEIAPAARRRVLEAVEGFTRQVEKHNGRWVGGVATSACRRASESSVKSLFESVGEMTNSRPELIDGEREAELTHRGVAASLSGLESGRIVDIGGGSTEWIAFNEEGLESTESLTIGVVTLLERCVENGVCTRSEASCMKDVLDQLLIPRNTSTGPLVCVGGTGTTLAAVNLGLETYDPERVHGSVLDETTVDELYDEYLGQPFEEIATDPMIQDGREDVILPGILILKKSMELASVSEVVVSDMGILAGLISEALEL